MDKLARILVWSALCALVVTGLPAVPASADYKIIVNAANPVTELTAEQASDLFLKQTAAWPNGVWVEPVDQHRANAIREPFTRDVHRRSVAAVRSYWQRTVFSGRATPAPILRTDSAVVDFVARRSGGIGYVSTNAPLNDQVRVVALTN